jgi:hypothetical protein
VHDRHLGEDFERRVVVHLDLTVSARSKYAAVTVIRVLVHADVGQDDEIRDGALHLFDRPRHGPVRVEGTRPAGVLLLRKTEEKHCAETVPCGFFRGPRGVLNR